MAKHRILYVTFALLLVASMSSSSRTSITTIEIDEGNPTGQSLDACKRYLVQSSRPRSGWREEFQQCCEQLEEMDERSRCEGIRRIAQQEKQQQGGSRGGEVQEMMQTARSLPGLCRMEPRRCEIRALLCYFFKLVELSIQHALIGSSLMWVPFYNRAKHKEQTLQ
ncbi:hypothetical protein RJ639_020204 [Escallonia herrerae]|uniref:Bifunctional inhibitor/plant lipid transfer protein/seed storage helical domain-containing protein n=1 Tax=Escallonia herrerae TaxID=1293975 RepID=A0AA89AJE9_9ASTE|nr:hypothetical protein RJ639_020204 [Escallonia herrerae]